jgi:hypothetical protein
MPSATATLPEGTAWPSEIPSPMDTASPPPEASPTLPIVEGLTPEQVQNIQETVENNGSGIPAWEYLGEPISLGYNSQINAGGSELYAGSFLAARKVGETPSDETLQSIVTIVLMKDSAGNAHTVNLFSQRTPILVNPQKNLEVLVSADKIVPMTTNEFLGAVNGERYADGLMYAMFPDRSDWARLKQFLLNPSDEKPEFIDDLNSTTGPILGQCYVYSPKPTPQE